MYSWVFILLLFLSFKYLSLNNLGQDIYPNVSLNSNQGSIDSVDFYALFSGSCLSSYTKLKQIVLPPNMKLMLQSCIGFQLLLLTHSFILFVNTSYFEQLEIPNMLATVFRISWFLLILCFPLMHKMQLHLSIYLT